MTHAPRADLDEAIALLARGLQGALEAQRLLGTEHLPRATLAVPAVPASVPASVPTTVPAGAAPRAVAKPAAAARLPIVQDGPLAAQIAAVVGAAGSQAERLGLLQREVIGECTRCKLHRGRNKLVFGVGNASSEIVFVGEGPGADEDRQGVPFVGRAGQLLSKMIEAMGYARGDVYICNVVKCRPPNNRDPEPDEVEACEGFLKAQLAIVQPKVIVCLGRHAAQTLLRSKTPITRMRGTWHAYEGIDLMPTYHPSFLLREEADPEKKRKREAWGDLQQVMKKLGRSRPAS